MFSVDDEQDWWEAVADVRPLRKAAAKPLPKPAGPKLVRVSHDPAAVSGPDPLPLPADTRPRPFDIAHHSASRLSGAEPGVDARLRRRLARGDMRPDARLDLHGLYLDDAHAALMEFLAGGGARRCVLVIHGKGRGYGPAGDMGIIKAHLPGWLAHHPAVMAFESATPRDGGSGAVYVLLRRRGGEQGRGAP